MNWIKKLMSALLFLAPFLAAVQWPDKQVRLVVPYVADGTGDLVARLLVGEMRQTLGQLLLVENKPGAASNIGVKRVG